MNVELIIDLLAQKGYKAEKQEVNKNGIIRKGIVILMENCELNPTIYLERFEGMSEGEIAEEIVEILPQYAKPETKGITEKLHDLNYIINNVYLSIQMNNEPGLFTLDEYNYLNIKAYFTIDCGKDNHGSRMSTKVRKGHITMLAKINNITEEEVIETLHQNSITNMMNKIHIKNMTELLIEMNPYLSEHIPFEQEDNGMTVLTNTDKFRGASYVLINEALKKVCEKMKVDEIFIIPSSIHEVICVPVTAGITETELKEMIREVNDKEVDPEERLSYDVYKYDVNTDTLGLFIS